MYDQNEMNDFTADNGIAEANATVFSDHFLTSPDQCTSDSLLLLSAPCDQDVSVSVSASLLLHLRC